MDRWSTENSLSLQCTSECCEPRCSIIDIGYQIPECQAPYGATARSIPNPKRDGIIEVRRRHNNEGTVTGSELVLLRPVLCNESEITTDIRTANIWSSFPVMIYVEEVPVGPFHRFLTHPCSFPDTTSLLIIPVLDT